MAGELARRKVERIRESGARTVVSGNPGCLLQIAQAEPAAGIRARGRSTRWSCWAAPCGTGWRAGMKIRVREHVTVDRERMAKVALAATSRAQLDLYCVAPGQAQKPHVHGDQDKIYYVLEGARALQPRRRRASGSRRARSLVAPAGVEHGLVNDGEEPLLVLVVVTPPPPTPRPRALSARGIQWIPA